MPMLHTGRDMDDCNIAEEDTPRRAEMGLTGWIDCYGKSSLKGHLFCGGVNDARDIEGNNKLQEAYEMGKGV